MDRGYPASPSYLTVSGSNMSGPDATNNYDTNVAASDTSIMSSLYAAEQYSSCPSAAVMGLNYNWSAMTSLVNSMSPNGNTNQAIGLQLGWLSLVGGGPFTAPPMDSNYKYTQAIILLTDGLNTENRWSTSQSSIDARQQLTCNNINTAGITLYTIQVNTGGDPTSTLLQNCAGSPGHYPDSSKFFLLTSSSRDPERVHPDRHRTKSVANCPIASSSVSPSGATNKKPGQPSRALSLTLTQRYATKLNNARGANYFAFAIKVSNGL